uniref:Uncharacterized protein n=1 Tax=Cannabis sativa TaxID=3483 RepID=A0A803QNS0_CANSA
MSDDKFYLEVVDLPEKSIGVGELEEELVEDVAPATTPRRSHPKRTPLDGPLARCSGEDYVGIYSLKPNNPENQRLKPPLVEGKDILVISGGPHLAGESTNAQKRYVNEVKNEQSVFAPEPLKKAKIEEPPIVFLEGDTKHVRYPHVDTLIYSSTRQQEDKKSLDG